MVKKAFHHAKTFDQKPIVLVAGDVGFIGSYLCELLLLKNCQVIAVDDILKKKIEKIDYVFCLTETGVQKIEKLLRIAEKFGAKFLLSIHKDAIFEKNIKDFLQTIKLNWRIVHLGFAYGPRMNLEFEDELVSLIKDAVTGGPLRIPGNGSKRVYPTFVSDIVYGLSKAMFSSGTEGKIFTLINPKGMTLLSFAQLLKDQSQEPLRIEFVPEKHHDPGSSHQERSGIENHLGGEARKSQTDLGWKAKVGIKEGIEQTLKYFRKKSGVADFSLRPTPSAFFPSDFPESLYGSLADSELGLKIKDDRVVRELKFASPAEKQPIPTTHPRPASHFPIPKESRQASFPHISSLILIPLLFLSLLFYPFVSLAFNGLLGVRSLKEAQQALLEVDFNQATKEARRTQQAFSQANQKIQQLSFFFEFFNLEKSGARVEKLFAVGNKVGGSLVHAGLAAQSATHLGKIIFQDQQGEIENLLSKIKIELDFAYGQLSLAEAEIRTVKDLLPIEVSLPEVRNLLLKAREGIKIIPEVIGVDGKRVYLVLLQNNMELRPTGGFIGSYALVTFGKGRLIDFEVEDVYTADGQLKGHVEPPAELKKYLGEAGWYLRDSNWDPDFPTSALRAEWFLEKETGRSVDGVIGVNLFLAQNILEQIGEVGVPDFQEKINSRNLFERAEYHSETGFFPGSTKKKDFLASLTRALFEKIEKSEEKIWLSLARAIYTSLNEKNLLVYLHEPFAMKTISDLGWDGSIRNVKCQSSLHEIPSEWSNVKCLSDYLMVVEANVGVNKANYFVERELTHQVKIDQDGRVKEVLQITYQNNSPSEAFPGGRYKNCLRVYVPLKSELIKLIVKDPQTGRSEEVGNEKWEIKEEHGKTVFGFLIEVPIKEQRIVEISYQLGEKIDFEETTQYLFLLQKQPGIKDKTFPTSSRLGRGRVNFWLTVPEGVALLEPKPNATQSLNTLLFNPEFNQDIVFEVGLVK